MAKRRLNKKAALIGSLVFAVLAVIVIVVVLFYTRDPKKFIADGDAALKAAREATDDETRNAQYTLAKRGYGKALKGTSKDEVKLGIYFKLMDLYYETSQWDKVMGCIKGIIDIDDKNVTARFRQLNYFYVLADSIGGDRAAAGLWSDAKVNAEKLMEIAQADGLLEEKVSKWDWPDSKTEPAAQTLGGYLYFVRACAVFQQADWGEEVDNGSTKLRDQDAYDWVIDDFEKVLGFEPGNVEAYRYQAQAHLAKAQMFASRRQFKEESVSNQQAQDTLNRAVTVAGDDPRTHINLLGWKLRDIGSKFSNNSSEDVVKESKAQMLSMEDDYLSLAKRFPSSSETYGALSQYYSVIEMNFNSSEIDSRAVFDKSLEAAKKAYELDNENPSYAQLLCTLLQRKCAVYGDKSSRDAAIKVAGEALGLDSVTLDTGPLQWSAKRYRLVFNMFQTERYFEQLFESRYDGTEDSEQVSQWIAGAEKGVLEIERDKGSGEDIQVVKYRGFLALAKGEEVAGLSSLYSVYSQFKAAGRSDGFLSYVLAKHYLNTKELGAAAEFMGSAVNAGYHYIEPDLLLDYGDLLVKLRNYRTALAVMDAFERRYPANTRSRQIRINSYIGSNQVDEAEKAMAEAEFERPDAIRIQLLLLESKIRNIKAAQRAKQQDAQKIADGKEVATDPVAAEELDKFSRQYAELVRELISLSPKTVEYDYLATACNSYVANNKISEAAALADMFLSNSPENVNAAIYRLLLDEPDPRDVPKQRIKEIEQQVLSAVKDPVQRSLGLGAFFYRYDENEKAVSEFNKVIDIESVLNEGSGKLTQQQSDALSYLFELSIKQKDWEQADRLSQIARRKNVDRSRGELFFARLSMAQKRYDEAIASLDKCIELNPIYSTALALRSRAKDFLGDNEGSISDARQAQSQNPLSAEAAKVLVFSIYHRNEKLGKSKVTDLQRMDLQRSLEMALALNPAEPQLNGLYAELTSSTRPMYAIAIRQSLLKQDPSVQNALLLARMAATVAMEQADPAQKKVLTDIADSAFAQARSIDPGNQQVLAFYADYKRMFGKSDEAEAILEQAQNKSLLWRHYYQLGRYTDAKAILGQMYQENPKDVNAVRGLMDLAVKMKDYESVEKHSQELISLADTADNRLLQIQALIDMGLGDQARIKLQSTKEKYPDDLRIRLFESSLAMNQGNLERALELVNGYLISDDTSAKAWILRGAIYLLMGRYREAVADLEKSKNIVADTQARILLARAYIYSSRTEKAIEELTVVFNGPQSSNYAGLLLEHVYKSNNSTSALEKFYDDAMLNHAEEALWFGRAADYYSKKRDFEKAQKLYLEALGKKADTGYKMTLFDSFLGSLIGSKKFDKVLEIGANNTANATLAPIANVRMAEAKIGAGDKVAAAAYWKKAVDSAQLDSSIGIDIIKRVRVLAGSQELLGYLQSKINAGRDLVSANLAAYFVAREDQNYNKAIDHIGRCIEIAGPSSKEIINYQSLRALAYQSAYAKTSDSSYFERSVAEYESVLKKMPNNSVVLNNLSYLLAEKGLNLDKALEYAKRAYEEKPNMATFMDTYAYALYKNGRNDEADRFLQRALQQYERDEVIPPADVYEHLGMVKEKEGSKSQALAAYKQAIENGGGELADGVEIRLKKAIERLSN